MKNHCEETVEVHVLVAIGLGKLVKPINARDGETSSLTFPHRRLVYSEKMNLVIKSAHNRSNNVSEDRDFKLS